MIVSVTEVPDQWEGAHNRLWQRTYSRTFRVVTSSRNDGPVAVRGAVDPGTGMRVPQIGNSYNVGGLEVDNGSFAENISFRFENFAAETGGCSWLVTVNYGPYDAQQFTESPTDWPIKFSWSAQKFQIAAEKDVDTGDPIANSAGDPFKDPAMIDQSRPILTVVRNEAVASYDDTIANQFRDHINSQTWNGFAPFTVKIGEISTSDPQYDSNSQTWYFAVRYVFEFDEDEWMKVLYDQGINHLDTSTPPKLVKIKDKDGQPVSEPQPLDGSGQVRAAGAPAVFLAFDVYPEVDFAPLKINLKTALGR